MRPVSEHLSDLSEAFQELPSDLFRQTEFGNALGVHVVETIGVLKDSLVASGADILNNGLGAACDFGINRAVDCDKFREFGREIRLLGI